MEEFVNKSRFLREVRLRLILLHGLVNALHGLWCNLYGHFSSVAWYEDDRIDLIVFVTFEN